MPGRVWVIAPDRQSLEARWNALVREPDATKKETLFHPHLVNGSPGDKHTNKELKSGLYGHEFRANPVATDTGNCIAPRAIRLLVVRSAVDHPGWPCH